MITTVEAYKLFRAKITDTASTRNIAVDLSKFVILFNKNYITTIKKFLDKNTDELDYIQEFLITDQELLEDSTEELYTKFHLPKNYLEYDSISATAKSGSCTDRIEVFPIIGKLKVETMLMDSSYQPSFSFRESLFRISNNLVFIYKKDFSIKKAYISYYKTPKLIGLENPRDPESKLIDSVLEGSRYLIDAVVAETVAEYALSNQDYNKFEGEKINNK